MDMADCRLARRAIIVAPILVAAVSLHFGTQGASAKSKRGEQAAAPVAAPQSAVRPSPPARFFSINQVLAQRAGQGAVHAQARVAAADSSGPNSLLDAQASAWVAPALGSEPFRLFTFRAPEGPLWAKWRLLEQDLRREASVLDRCRTEPDRCPTAARLFLNLIAELAEHVGRPRLELVNQQVNAAIRYQSDMAQHGMPDLWSAPLATFESGRGDCEDYAIAKYVALREAGVAEDDLRLLLVKDLSAQQDHAVLAARHEGRWLILDNLRHHVSDDGEIGYFVPLFALGQQGVKLLAAPYAADAQRAEQETVPLPSTEARGKSLDPASASVSSEWGGLSHTASAPAHAFAR